jgi:hypothetical protein
MDFKKYFNIFAMDIYKGSKIEKEMPEILAYLNRWNILARALRVIHITLGFLSVLFSLLTAAQISPLNTDWPKVYAFIAALSIGLMTAFDMGTKSNNTRTAWRNLNASVIKFNQGLIDKQGVIDAYEEGEKSIGDVVFQNR